MLVLHAGTSTAYRVEVGDNITDYTSTSFNIPALYDLDDVDYDFVDDRLYILGNHYFNYTVKSVFVNGTDEIFVADVGSFPRAIAVEPFEKIIFVACVPSSSSASEIVSMGIDGSNSQIIVERPKLVSSMAVDYQNKYLYWSEISVCFCVHRARYNGKEYESSRGDIYISDNPHGMDFANNLVYGHSITGTVYGISLDNGRETSKGKDDAFKWFKTEVVYDSKTDRIFIVTESNILVYTASGTRLGSIEEFHRQGPGEIVVRVNPIVWANQTSGEAVTIYRLFQVFFQNLS